MMTSEFHHHQFGDSSLTHGRQEQVNFILNPKLVLEIGAQRIIISSGSTVLQYVNKYGAPNGLLRYDPTEISSSSHDEQEF